MSTVHLGFSQVPSKCPSSFASLEQNAGSSFHIEIERNIKVPTPYNAIDDTAIVCSVRVIDCHAWAQLAQRQCNTYPAELPAGRNRQVNCLGLPTLVPAAPFRLFSWLKASKEKPAPSHGRNKLVNSWIL